MLPSEKCAVERDQGHGRMVVARGHVPCAWDSPTLKCHGRARSSQRQERARSRHRGQPPVLIRSLKYHLNCRAFAKRADPLRFCRDLISRAPREFVERLRGHGEPFALLLGAPGANDLAAAQHNARIPDGSPDSAMQRFLGYQRGAVALI